MRRPVWSAPWVAARACANPLLCRATATAAGAHGSEVLRDGRGRLEDATVLGSGRHGVRIGDGANTYLGVVLLRGGK
ncbi:hypothetical protein VM98_37360, partial [Streptomyces rubellomurinus subsp. indigoferus]